MKVMKSLRVMQCTFMFFMILLPFQLSAQKNIREGYVVTLQGDTLYGEIDFRMPSMNMKRCVFKQKGADSFKTYLPGEIYSYRFTNNGIYYVSKKVDTDEGGSEIVFVEHVIRGSMNLYQVGGDEMLLEDEEGNMAKFSMEKANKTIKARELHEEMDGVLHLLDKSTNAKNIIFKKNKNRDNTKAAVMAYVDEVCPDGYCEVFEYRKKKTPVEDRMVHPWVKVGAKVTQYKLWDDDKITGCSPRFSVGADFHFNRVFRGLIGTIGVSYEHGKASRDVNKLFVGEPGVSLNGYKLASLDFNQWDILVGPGYQFQCGAVKMNAKAGVLWRMGSHNFDYTYGAYYYRGQEYTNHYTTSSGTFDVDFHIGCYVSAGVEYPMKKFSLLFDLEYIRNPNTWSIVFADKRFLDDDMLQNGFSLSVGVKF